MNGYQKMKNLRRMKIVKVVSTVTALSMAVTGMIISASANEASADAIAKALGDLTNYGIVTGQMSTSSHFESNFAAKDLTLSNNFDLDNFVKYTDRSITFSVSTKDSDVSYYFGVYSGDKRINVICNGDESDIIKVKFDEPGTKSFVVYVPNEHKYSELTVCRLIPEKQSSGDIFYVRVMPGTRLEVEAEDDGDLLGLSGTCLVSEDMIVGGELFTTNKTVNVGPDIWDRIGLHSQDKEWYINGKFDEDGNYINGTGTKIANNTNKFALEENAVEIVDDLLGSLQTASDELAELNTLGDKALYLTFNGNVGADTPCSNGVKINGETATVKSAYQYIVDHPEYVMLVKVNLNKGENEVLFNSTAIGNWDVDPASRIVFNFISPSGADASNTSLYLANGFRGTALVPNARVTCNNILGAVYAPEFVVKDGELHMATYGALNNKYEIGFDVEPEETTTTTTTTTTETEPEETEYSEPEDSEPEETEPEETEPEETEPEETEPEETEPEETEPEETEPEETEPEETEPEETEPEETEPEETEPEETEPEETEPEETEPEETEPEETEPEETEPEETEPEETEPEETEPEETEPEETEPEETEPEETTTTTTTPEETTTTTTTTTTPPSSTVVITSNDVTVATVPTTTTTYDITSDVQTTTLPPAATTTASTRPLIAIPDDDIPTDDLIIIDEDIPLGDLPLATGVESNVGTFMIIGGAALTIGVGAQVYTVVLKKKK